MCSQAYPLWLAFTHIHVYLGCQVHDIDLYYRKLGLTGLSSVPDDAVVKNAWRQQMQLCHPDRPGGSTEKASEVNEAFEKLSTGSSLCILSTYAVLVWLTVHP